MDQSRTRFRWTNASVLRFARDNDPVAAMESKARSVVLEAMDDGWKGPPFDPLDLAQRLGIRAKGRGDIPDARLIPVGEDNVTLEYNPTRPRGRVRFSIAHEIAHTFFDDYADEVRHRGGTSESSDNWQLESLCNIGAAELLMPMGSFTELGGKKLSIQKIIEFRKKFDVSVEACLIRSTKLSETPVVAFCASKRKNGEYQFDYTIPVSWNKCPLYVGQIIPKDSCIHECVAIGFTAVEDEAWRDGGNFRVECVGLPPYPGLTPPRVVGFIIPLDNSTLERRKSELVEIHNNALKPGGRGRRLLVHVVPDTNAMWGGRGFASKVRRTFPESYAKFKEETSGSGKKPMLGDTHFFDVGNGITIAHMVAQHGYGPSSIPRLKLTALTKCLSDVRSMAEKLPASVHMPRIGTGHGGVPWPVVRELISDELVNHGIQTTVYRLETT